MPTLRPHFDAYTVILVNRARFQHTIGVAFNNPDGTIGIVLNSLPLDGRIYLRPARPSKSPANPDPDIPHD